MTTNIIIGPKFEESDLAIQKLLSAKNPILEKNLGDFHLNIE